jgi:acyl carrier protein
MHAMVVPKMLFFLYTKSKNYTNIPFLRSGSFKEIIANWKIIIMDSEAKLKQAFKQGLGFDFSDFEGLEFAKTDGWDSIGHMKLIAALEEAFGIRLEVGEVLALNSYPTARQIVHKHIGKSP